MNSRPLSVRGAPVTFQILVRPFCADWASTLPSGEKATARVHQSSFFAATWQAGMVYWRYSVHFASVGGTAEPASGGGPSASASAAVSASGDAAASAQDPARRTSATSYTFPDPEISTGLLSSSGQPPAP